MFETVVSNNYGEGFSVDHVNFSVVGYIQSLHSY
jgi:hypothetical protein